MKLRAILERDISIPVSVDYEQEFQGPDGEWDTRIITIDGDVVVERDPYATGDSPTWTTFEPTAAYVKDTGDSLDLKQFLQSLDAKQHQWILDQATDRVEY